MFRTYQPTIPAIEPSTPVQVRWEPWVWARREGLKS